MGDWDEPFEYLILEYKNALVNWDAKHICEIVSIELTIYMV